MSSMKEIFSGYSARTSDLQASASTNPFAQGIAWVEGTFSPVHSARIPLMDQGFLRSDLTYDVVGVWDGSFFRLSDHLSRLETSCQKIRLKLPLSHSAIKQILIQMLVKSGIRDAYVDLIVTRGLKGVRGSKPGDLVNCMYMFVVPYIWVMSPEVQLSGQGSAIVARSVNRIHPGAVDPTVKNLQWGDFTRGMYEAMDRDAHHPFLTDGEGNLTEGSGFNIFLVKGGVLYTSDRGVLLGVTRKSVGDVARQLGFEVRVEVVPVDLAYRSEEIFMCTTAGGIMPITRLDGKSVGMGEVGPVTRAVWDGYWAMHYDPRYTLKVDYREDSAKL